MPQFMTMDLKWWIDGDFPCFDDKSGAYAVNEVLIRLAKGKGPNCKVIAVSTAEEEIVQGGNLICSFS